MSKNNFEHVHIFVGIHNKTRFFTEFQKYRNFFLRTIINFSSRTGAGFGSKINL